MRDSDGKFHLKLCYPELMQFNPPCNEWIQTSNPATETAITGYREVRITFKGSSTHGHLKFGGLAISPLMSRYTWIDADPLTSSWWYAIGALKHLKGQITIPGPVNGNKKGYNITKVELFVQTKGNNY